MRVQHAPRSAPALPPLPRRRLAASVRASADSAPAERRLFSFGMGYTTLALAHVAKQQGWHVSGACRDEDKAASLRGAGVDAFTWSPDDGRGLDGAGLDALRRATHVVTCVPPVADFDRDPVLATHQAQLLEASRPGGALRWVGYLSSTGVYGDHGGAWVDEDTPLRVTPAAGKPWLRAQAELTWRQLHAQHALPLHVFRLGGIYGPGRSIIEARRGRGDGGSASQRSRGEKRYISRCHVADIVAALLASMDAPAPGSVYNVVDDDPASRAEVSAFADALLRGEPEPPPPPPQQPGVGEVVLLGRDEKRVRNTRLKRDLGVVLRFPDYRAGLRALHAADKTPFA